MHLDLTEAILIYLIIVFVVFFLTRYALRVTIWSSLVLALVVGIIILSAICPISSIDKVFDHSGSVTALMFIYLITLLVVLFYILDRVLRDVDPAMTREKQARWPFQKIFD